MIIGFKKMSLNEEGNTVKIIGEVVNPPKKYNDEISIEMSILQLAKVWSTDRRKVSKVENGFGAGELEDECEETKEEVKNFPNIEFWNKEIKFDFINITGTAKEKNMHICAEDISGWSNEGIRIEMPKKIYDAELNDKEFELILTPASIILKTIKQEFKKDLPMDSELVHLLNKNKK